jgi:hypothetical protein
MTFGEFRPDLNDLLLLLLLVFIRTQKWYNKQKVDELKKKKSFVNSDTRLLALPDSFQTDCIIISVRNLFSFLQIVRTKKK